MRIFCADEQEAQSALIEIAKVLRRRGLSLQSAKTFIMNSGDSRAKIEGTAPVLLAIQRKWRDDIVESLDLEDDPYLTVPEIDALLEEDPDKVPIEVIREAFNVHFGPQAPLSFDKTLFHFLLKRLGNAGDRHALSEMRRLLAQQPQETNYILTYVKRTDSAAIWDSELHGFMDSAQGSVYPTQSYLILSWLSGLGQTPSDDILAVARRLAFDQGTARHTRAVARAVLGQHADISDLERLEALYDTVQDPLERAQIICCLGRLETSRLKGFAGRAKLDGEWSARAVSWVLRDHSQTK